MTDSSDQPPRNANLWSERFDFELPIAPDYVEYHKPLTLAEMLPLIANRRKWFPISEMEREMRRNRHVAAAAEFTLE